MNEPVAMIQMDLHRWRARVGEAVFHGTRESCLEWLVERQCEVVKLSNAIHLAIATQLINMEIRGKESF